jgi:hypothetical protein
MASVSIYRPKINVFQSLYSVISFLCGRIQHGVRSMTIEQQIADILTSYTASKWAKSALESAMQRDILDAARDAEMVASLLRKLANQALGR